jgi:hypothetical protein
MSAAPRVAYEDHGPGRRQWQFENNASVVGVLGTLAVNLPEYVTVKIL